MSKEIAYKILDSSKILENNEVNLTSIGSIDNEFSHLKHTYRNIYQGHCKITYREGSTKIYIVRVFDTRQNPNKNK